MELNERNYRRILVLNLLLLLPSGLLFAWPYRFLCTDAGMGPIWCGPGSLLFALPFVLTILHGHVTMVLGPLHRHHFYNWLARHPVGRVLFHPALVRTRTRMLLLLVTLVWSVAALLFGP